MLISLETLFFVTVLWPGAQVQFLFVFRASGVALGALGAVPMFVYGLYLGTRHWPWLDKSRARSARGDKQVNFFGRNRQVGAPGTYSFVLGNTSRYRAQVLETATQR